MRINTKTNNTLRLCGRYKIQHLIQARLGNQAPCPLHGMKCGPRVALGLSTHTHINLSPAKLAQARTIPAQVATNTEGHKCTRWPVPQMVRPNKMPFNTCRTPRGKEHVVGHIFCANATLATVSPRNPWTIVTFGKHNLIRESPPKWQS